MAPPSQGSLRSEIPDLAKENVLFGILSSVYSGNGEEEMPQKIRVRGNLEIETTFPDRVRKLKFNALNFVNEVSNVDGSVPYKLLHIRVFISSNDLSYWADHANPTRYDFLKFSSVTRTPIFQGSLGNVSMWDFQMVPALRGIDLANFDALPSIQFGDLPHHNRPPTSSMTIISYWSKFELKKKKKWLPKSFQNRRNRPAGHSDLMSIINLDLTPSDGPSEDVYRYRAQLEVRDGSTKSNQCQGLAPHDRVKIQTSTVDDTRKINFGDPDAFYRLYEKINDAGLFDVCG